ncbi:MAG: hypothetical protein V1702_04055 [Candidatus Woesearchaeota archaeon]
MPDEDEDTAEDNEDNTEETDWENLTQIERDKTLLQMYKEYPQEFRDNLSFNEFYHYYRPWLEAIIKQKMADRIVKAFEGPSPKEEIPEAELCQRCQKERKSSMDFNYCYKCIILFQKEAQELSPKLVENLLSDQKFLLLKNQRQAEIYAKDKFAEEKKQNRFLPLNTIGVEAYQKRKMNL